LFCGAWLHNDNDMHHKKLKNVSFQGAGFFPCGWEKEQEMAENTTGKIELRLGLPKGRMQTKVVELFNDVGIPS